MRSQSCCYSASYERPCTELGTATTLYEVAAMKIDLLAYRPPRIAMLLLAVAATANLTLPVDAIGPASLRSCGPAVCIAGFCVMMQAWWQFKQTGRRNLSNGRDLGADHRWCLPLHSQPHVPGDGDHAGRNSHIRRNITVLPGGRDALCYPELRVLPVRRRKTCQHLRQYVPTVPKPRPAMAVNSKKETFRVPHAHLFQPEAR